MGVLLIGTIEKVEAASPRVTVLRTVWQCVDTFRSSKSDLAIAKGGESLVIPRYSLSKGTVTYGGIIPLPPP